MAEPLKNYINKQYIEEIADILKDISQDFPKQGFTEKVFDEGWESRELKERTKHIAKVFHTFFSDSYNEACSVLVKLSQRLKEIPTTNYGVGHLFIPDYIECFGLDNFDKSVYAIERITTLISAEFAVRPFLIRYKGQMIEQMYKWSQHPDHLVRRLSSEGCRPRLPWAIKLPDFIDNPTPILQILETLIDDPEEIVKKSVANNLNDISKDNPETVVEFTKKWIGKNKAIDKVLKHACRTLIKKGHPKILEVFDFTSPDTIMIEDISVQPREICIGESVMLKFKVKNKGPEMQHCRISYAIDFVKKTGKVSPKEFKVSERDLRPNDTIIIERAIWFKELTTRKHYPGKHKIKLLINTVEKGYCEINLI